MSKWIPSLRSILGGVVGVLLGLLVWRAYVDYTDFLKMRIWVAQVQSAQAEAAKQQQGQTRVLQQPAPDEVQK